MTSKCTNSTQNDMIFLDTGPNWFTHRLHVLTCYLFRCYLNKLWRTFWEGSLHFQNSIRRRVWQRSCNDNKEAVSVRKSMSRGVTWALSPNASSALINPNSAGNNNVASERSDWVRQLSVAVRQADPRSTHYHNNWWELRIFSLSIDPWDSSVIVTWLPNRWNRALLRDLSP